MNINLDSIINEIDHAKKLSKNGGEYWMGRDIQKILGYSTWENFNNVIQKARMACESMGFDALDHFREITKPVEAGSGTMVQKSDYFLWCRICSPWKDS